MGFTNLMCTTYTKVAENISKPFVDFLAGSMDNNKIDGFCGWLDKGDEEFRASLHEHIAKHPEDTEHAKQLLQAIDNSEYGIEIRFFDH